VKSLTVLILFAVGGCCTTPPTSDDLMITQATVTFREEKAPPDMTGFLKHWTVGTATAWFCESKGEVLVLGPGEKQVLRISGFPKGYGRICATGWEKDTRFFVHLGHGPDAGTMIYCDLERRKITEVKHWAAF
jgi:hypothetical protein